MTEKTIRGAKFGGDQREEMKMNPSEPVVQLTREQLAQQLKEMEEAENQGRVSACAQDIMQVLNKHNCNLEVQMILREGKVNGQVLIVPRTAPK